jgi:hypothetical protein
VELSEKSNKSIVAGVTTLDDYLSALQLGVGPIAFFAFNCKGYQWTSHAGGPSKWRPLSTWIAMQLYNQHAAERDMLAVTTESNPTIHVEDRHKRRGVQKFDVPQLGSYAFKDKDGYVLILINRHMEKAAEVAFDLSGPVRPERELYRLTSDDPLASNRFAVEVEVRRSALSDFSPDKGITVPPFSAYLLKLKGR